MSKQQVTLNAGKFKKKCTLWKQDGRICIKFPYNKRLLHEIKMMQGARWEPDGKYWHVNDVPRNHFNLSYLMGKSVYDRYRSEITTIDDFRRPLREHQKTFVNFILSRHYCLIAAEMGTGKTLAWIEAAERIKNPGEIWYVGPKAGVRAVSRELKKWDAKFDPVMLTYEGMVKKIRNWEEGRPAPQMVCFDESQKVKTHTSQRSKSALHLANAIRDEWKEDGYAILMSGTPAPKSPVDWWHQVEICCPGYLYEGDPSKFKKELCIIEERESITGGVYPHIVAWLDNENKCAECGETKIQHDGSHPFVKSENKVSKLYKRLDGIAIVTFKKDCLDLPEKQYEIIRVKPTVETLRAAKLIRATSSRAITALTLLRELSDGFQYTDEKVGVDTCPECRGSGKCVVPVPLEIADPLKPAPTEFQNQEVICDCCGGDGQVTRYKRASLEVKTPKDEVFIEELESHSDIGRYIVWGGFTGTIDRLVQMSKQQGWNVLRVDGRGYHGMDHLGETRDAEELLEAMDRSSPNYDSLMEKYPKVCFCGHPQAGGMALTLTASPTELFYSNSFDGEARMQAEDRFHRIGMDENRGAVIKDLIHLSTDQLVLDNLKKKKKLQNLTMGDLDYDYKTDQEAT